MAKTFNYLFEQIYDFENLYQAYLLARRGKRMRKEAIRFRCNLEGNLIQIQNELMWQTYKTAAYRYFIIHEPKRREIAALPFRDRIVQHALVRIIGPIWEKRFIADSYACRLGKGTHAGADRAERFLRIVQRNSRQVFALKADISKYFASIDHGILMGLLKRRIQCQRTVWLLDEIVNSNGQTKGIPIGNLTSQLFANIYLHELDRLVKDGLRERYYVRYMDDFCVIGPDKARLHDVWDAVEQFLADYLRLSLNRKTQLFPVSPGRGRALDFLGYRIWTTHRKLRKASAKRFRRAMAFFVKQHRQGKITFSQINPVVQSWIGHARHADTYRLRKAILDQARFSAVGQR